MDPKLVFVIELGAPVDPDEFRTAGLRVLDGSDRRFVVAFSDDPQVAAFVGRLEACAGGVPPERQSEPYAAFVDAINRVRPLAPADRLSADLARFLVEASPHEELRLDVELWHPDDRDLARAWVDDLRTAVTQAGGRVADTYVNDAAGVILARIYLPAREVLVLAEIDTVARLDLLPTPSLTLPQFWRAGATDLPTMQPPRSTAPIVGVVDSGVASAHPLVGPAVMAAEALSPAIPNGEDRHGHGTMVAGLILHGPVDRVVARGFASRPLCRLVSVAVLTHESVFPSDQLWERDLVEAIEWCAAQGASIINLSVGDARRPLATPRQLPAAALVDELARRLDLVIVVAAGNSRPLDYLSVLDEGAHVRYPFELINDPSTGILDPGTAALALTVGGITTASAATGYSSHETAARRPLGEPGWPSAITRRGPGVERAVKPEVVELSGTLGIESDRLVDLDPELGVISTRIGPGGLLWYLIGTSAAAPLVTRIAAAVKARHPDFGANLIRALVLLSTEPSAFVGQLDGGEPADRQKAGRDLLGYGQPVLARAIESTTHRAILVAESSVPIDGVHIYEIPVPTSFFASGGSRGIEIALAYSPRTRVSRLDYRSNRMDFTLIRGMPLAEVIDVVTKLEDDQEVDLEQECDAAADVDSLVGTEVGADGTVRRRPPTLSQLRSKVVKLQPSSRVRGAGANQLGRKVFGTRLDEGEHTPMFLVVRNVNRWEMEGAVQPYALAVALWRSEDRAAIYAELEASLEAVVALPIEVEVEL